MVIKTNLEEVMTLNDDMDVLVYRDAFLSNWGGHGVAHAVVLTGENISSAMYKLRRYAYQNQNEGIRNLHISKLKNLHYNDVTYINGFHLADIQPIKA